MNTTIRSSIHRIQDRFIGRFSCKRCVFVLHGTAPPHASSLTSVPRESSVVRHLSPTRVLSRLPAWRIGIIDQETAIIEHCSLAWYLDSTVLLACWLVLPLSLPFRSTLRRVDARAIPVI